MFDKLLFLFLVLSPLCFSGGQDLFQYAGRFLMLGTMALAAVSLACCKPARVVLPKWPVWLLLFLIFKVYYFPYHPLTVHGTFNVFFCLGVFYLVVNYAKDIKWLYKAVFVVCFINIIYGLMNYFGFNPIFTYTGAPAAFFATNSDLSGYMILALPLMAHYLRGFGFVLPFLFIAFFLKNFTGITCAGLSGFFLTLRKGFYPMFTLVIVALSVIALMKMSRPYSIPYKLGYRVELWKAATTGALCYPLVGNGLGRAIAVTEKTSDGAFTFKSDYLEFAWEVGIVPAMFFTGFIFYTLFMRYLQAQRSWDLTLISLSLLAFGMSLFVQPHLRNPKISPTVMALLGYFYILTERRKS